MRKVVSFFKKSIPLVGLLSYLASSSFNIANAQITPVNLGNIPNAINAGFGLDQIIGFAIGLIFVLGIIIAIGFLIYGGIKWVMSGGDKVGVEAARNHIVAAIVGLVIIAGAFLILNIVFTLITGHSFNVSNICIPTLGNAC